MRNYFVEAATLCNLDVDVLLKGTGRLSKVLQNVSIQEQSLSRDTSPSTEQDLARSTSLDTASHDAASSDTASSDATSAWNGSTSIDAVSYETASDDAASNDAMRKSRIPGCGISKEFPYLNKTPRLTVNAHTCLCCFQQTRAQRWHLNHKLKHIAHVTRVMSFEFWHCYSIADNAIRT